MGMKELPSTCVVIAREIAIPSMDHNGLVRAMMTPEMSLEMSAKLKRSITLHEQNRKFPYLDTRGKITIGYGYNLDDLGLPDDMRNTLYQDAINSLYPKFCTFSWFLDLNEDRQLVLLDMTYNLGWNKFLEFEKLIKALSNHDYNNASFEMLSSDWADQTKSRAVSLATGMQTGEYKI